MIECDPAGHHTFLFFFALLERANPMLQFLPFSSNVFFAATCGQGQTLSVLFFFYNFR